MTGTMERLRAVRPTSSAAKLVSDHEKRSRQQNRRAPRDLVVGGSPRVDLLPTEVLVDRRQRVVVRRVWFGVAVVAALVLVGSGMTALDQMSSASQLRTAQSEGTALLQQQGRYSDVRDVEGRSDLVRSAQAVGGATEIDWAAYLQSAQDSLPAGVAITGVTVDSASPLAPYTQADAPLQGVRIATVTFDADSPTLPSIPDWLDRVRGLKGFVDANANAVSRVDEDGHYTVNMTVHVNEAAYDGKYEERSK